MLKLCMYVWIYFLCSLLSSKEGRQRKKVVQKKTLTRTSRRASVNLLGFNQLGPQSIEDLVSHSPQKYIFFNPIGVQPLSWFFGDLIIARSPYLSSSCRRGISVKMGFTKQKFTMKTRLIIALRGQLSQRWLLKKT